MNSQDSLFAQLHRVAKLAEFEGEYDAADWIKTQLIQWARLGIGDKNEW